VTHLSEEFLDRYLDDDLAPEERARVDGHLAGCATCRAELAALAGLYSTLDALPAEPLPVDLSPRVLARIRSQSKRRSLRLVEALLVAQVALTLALAAWLVPLLGPRLPVVPWPALDVTALSPAHLAAPLAERLPGGATSVALAPLPLALGVALVVALWLVSNRLMLGGVTPRDRRERSA
jgi:anti-sigma factor RsiW